MIPGFEGETVSRRSGLKSFPRNDFFLPIRPLRFSVERLAITTLFIIFAALACRGDELATSSGIGAKLSSPTVLLLDGKPLRDALRQTAKLAGVNLWLDRKVDPNALVSPGQLGPTFFAALESIANECDCVLMVCKNVVIIGRESWVDPLAVRLMAQPEARAARNSVVNVHWEDLTTPTVALARVSGGTIAKSDVLPHDLWPETDWKSMQRDVAQVLIRAQFDFPLKTSDSARLTRKYETGSRLNEIRALTQQLDSHSKIKIEDGWMSVTSTMATHRQLTASLLRKGGASVGKVDDRRFDLKVINQRADVVLSQFAQAAGRICRIEPAAVPACESRVTIEASQKSLAELIEMVAERVNVQVKWTVDAVVVSAKD